MIELPESVQEIADVIGRTEALRLIGQLPTCIAGVEGHKSKRVILYVPKQLKAGHRLVEILGWDTAQKLVDVFGGEILCPANCHAVFADFMRRAIAAMLATGESTNVVAVMFDVHERTVRKIRYANGVEPPQEEINQGEI